MIQQIGLLYGIFGFIAIGAFLGAFGHAGSVARAQEASVAATQSEMYAAMGKITFFAETTTGVGPIDSSKPLMTVNVRNDSDYPLTMKSFSVTFAVSGSVTAWPALDSNSAEYTMSFHVPYNGKATMTFPCSGYHIIEPHTTGRLDLFAEIPNANPKVVTIANATTLAQVEFLLGPWMHSRVTNLPCRNWRIE